eukprot:gene6263-6082_t
MLPRRARVALEWTALHGGVLFACLRFLAPLVLIITTHAILFKNGEVDGKAIARSPSPAATTGDVRSSRRDLPEHLPAAAADATREHLWNSKGVIIPMLIEHIFTLFASVLMYRELCGGAIFGCTHPHHASLSVYGSTFTTFAGIKIASRTVLVLGFQIYLFAQLERRGPSFAQLVLQ